MPADGVDAGAQGAGIEGGRSRAWREPDQDGTDGLHFQVMTQPVAETLVAKKCLPCEGGVAELTPEEAGRFLEALPAWRITHEGRRIRRDITAADFRSAVKLINNIAALAEREQHHPDLHVEGYRRIWIEIHTHAIGGLSENDFILAAKIDAIAPVV